MGNGLKPCKQQHPSFLYEPLINPPILEEAENENLRVFSITELKKATNKFSKDRVEIGQDRSLRTFYKGKGYIDGTTFATSRTKTGIAVSVMEYRPHALQAWTEEVKSLGKISHPNLVKILGYCCEDDETLLVVYEYLHKGSLDHYIFGKEAALPWETRVKIAIGTAQGLAFLHSIKNSPLHRDLRMHNIMLDEQYNAKLFYIESNQQVVDDKIYRGEAIYIPPECLRTGHSGMVNDVYAFGVILLELLIGSKDRADRVNKQSLDEWTRPFFAGEIIDPRLGNDYPVNAAIQMGALIQSCTACDKKKRPVMQHVLDVLNIIAELKY